MTETTVKILLVGGGGTVTSVLWEDMWANIVSVYDSLDALDFIHVIPAALSTAYVIWKWIRKIRKDRKDGTA